MSNRLKAAQVLSDIHITIGEVARLAGLTVDQLEYRLKRGQAPGPATLTAGRHRRWRIEDVIRFLEAQPSAAA